ncbi:DUF4381 domain-containing protein [Photobacterium sp. SDRW27]|uniref:DUF4381 domain-containing protein n=1 Tax=Photobacterium obscurum TaxID=2829490 RepID=UPI002242CEF9|nr:DUF4381 domain-containing protein [Photobacterium obscurum]MCW8330198.1 DUF4381 domain-containing protein [Photobacterium obscurum]
MADPISANNMAASLPLADVHLPPAPGFWPLAWGWWLCILIALAGLFFLIFKLKQHLQQQEARKEALLHLKKMNNPSQFNEINLLLRQTAMTYYPREQVAGLTGQHWLAFLDSQLKEQHRGFIALSDNWQQGLFSPQGLEQLAFSNCYQQAERWLKKAHFPARGTFKPASQEVSNV